MNRTLTLAVVGLVVAMSGATGALARGPGRMLSVDTTQGGKPIIHDNGVNDGRVCKIFMKKTWDPWIEDFRQVKTKKCI